ncbi:MAG: hypothetical protein ACK5AC_17555 [Planctomycetota bacterium]|jgi:hypothetical protein
MARSSWLRRLYWRYLAKPASCRELFLHADAHPVGSILEIGMGSGERIRALLPMCHDSNRAERLRYAALDPFESSGEGRLTLKSAHRLLQELGVKAHLVPGDLSSGLVRLAHTILPSDLVIIDGHWGDGSEQAEILERWLPRLCHLGSAIFVSTVEGGKLVRIDVPATASGSRSQIQAAA